MLFHLDLPPEEAMSPVPRSMAVLDRPLVPSLGDTAMECSM